MNIQKVKHKHILILSIYKDTIKFGLNISSITLLSKMSPAEKMHSCRSVCQCISIYHVDLDVNWLDKFLPHSHSCNCVDLLIEELSFDLPKMLIN